MCGDRAHGDGVTRGTGRGSCGCGVFARPGLRCKARTGRLDGSCCQVEMDGESEAEGEVGAGRKFRNAVSTFDLVQISTWTVAQVAPKTIGCPIPPTKARLQCQPSPARDAELLMAARTSIIIR